MPFQIIKPPQMKKGVALLAGGLTLLLLVNSLVTLMLIKSYCPKMVTFDMKGTVDTFFTHASQKKLTEAQSQQLATRFTQTLDNTLRDYQQKNQVVILVSPAVVVGAPEVTKTIQRQVATKMREHQQ